MTDELENQTNGPENRPDLGAEVDRAIEQTERVNVASYKLPDSGPIADDVCKLVCQRVQAIINRQKLRLSDLAKQLGFPQKSGPGILSQVLRQQYPYDSYCDYIRKLNAWVEATERRLQIMRPAGICETAVVKAVRTACDFAKSESCMVLISGPAGLGKTVSAQVYAAQDLNAVYLRLQSTHNSPTAFLRQLAAACRIETTETSRSRIMEVVLERLKGSHRLLLIDEWHQAANSKLVSECVRDLHDVAGIPVALIGTEDTTKRVTAARVRKGATWSDQFCSRIGFVMDLASVISRSGGSRPLFSVEEIREIFKSDQVRLTRDAMDYLQAMACSIGLGCLRITAKCFAMACRMVRSKDDEQLTAAHLRKAFRRLAVPEGIDDSALLAQIEETARVIAHHRLKVG